MKRKPQLAPLPFRINRMSQESLIDQVVRGFVNAIRAGHYKPGDRIPGVRDLATELRISQMAVRVAVRQLADRAEVSTRPKIGIHVAHPESKCWRAHVLLVYMSDTFYFTRFNRSLGTRLDDNGVRMTGLLWTPREYQDGLPHLRAILDGQPIDLAIVSGIAPGVISELERRDIPFVSVCDNTAPSARALAIVDMDRQHAIRDMIAHCQANGIRSVVTVVPLISEPTAWLEDRFAEAGIRCRMVCKPPVTATREDPEWVEEAGYYGTRSVLERRHLLPDLIFYLDDYAARGGLTAILEAGIRVPEDVQVIAWINRGHAPAFPKPLTHIEIHPAAQAVAVGDLALELLRTRRKRRAPLVFVPRFVPGATTQPRRPASP